MNNPNYPERLLSACHYQNALIADLISAFKYDGLRELVEPCCEILSRFFRDEHLELPQNWIMTSVPIDARKKEQRGFNQSELIARQFANSQNIDYKNLLEKQRVTKNQMKLDRKDRQTNLSEAFTATQTCAGKNIILFDDVITTGSTLLECTKELKKADANKIIWLTLARD